MIFVDFPAVLPVDSIKVEELVPYRKDAFIQLQKDGKTVKVVGNKYLSDAKVESIFKDAKTTTQALNDLRRAYVDAGHLLMKVDYFTNEEQIIFLVREYSVKKITGDESLVAYFEELQGESSLTYDEYETPRVRAEVYASRIGQQYKASYKVTGDKEVELQFTASDVEGHKDTMVFAEINNHGSRYSGEYNGKLGLTQTFDGGSRLTLLYGTPLAGLNEEDTGEMTQLVASLDYPTTYGVFGVTGVAVDYNRDQVGSTAAYDGQMNMITGNWSHILSSSKDTRFTMNAAVSQVDDTQKQGTAYEEKYMTGEVGFNYAQFERGEGAYSFSFGGSAKMGLTDDAEGTFAVADTSPANSALEFTERQSKFTTIKPSIAFVKSLGSKVDLQLTYNAQMANERLPQAQQYVLGGASSMSAWLPGVMIGDEGYHAKIALGYSFTMLNANWKVSVFTEKGESSYVNADDDLKQSASDSGIALVGQFGKSLTINLISARAADESFYADNVEEAKIKETNLLGQLVYRF